LVSMEDGDVLEEKEKNVDVRVDKWVDNLCKRKNIVENPSHISPIIVFLSSLRLL
jgi:hypothetical protein